MGVHINGSIDSVGISGTINGAKISAGIVSPNISADISSDQYGMNVGVGDLVHTDYPWFNGTTTVTPTTQQQTLGTQNKIMRSDVSVSPVAYAEVSNASGTTVTIGG